MMYQKSESYFVFDRGSINEKKLSQSGKMPPGDKAEIENVKYANGGIFHFISATRWRFWTLTPLIPSMSMDPQSKKDHSENRYAVYQISLKFGSMYSRYPSWLTQFFHFHFMIWVILLRVCTLGWPFRTKCLIWQCYFLSQVFPGQESSETKFWICSRLD